MKLDLGVGRPRNENVLWSRRRSDVFKGMQTSGECFGFNNEFFVACASVKFCFFACLVLDFYTGRFIGVNDNYIDATSIHAVEVVGNLACVSATDSSLQFFILFLNLRNCGARWAFSITKLTFFRSIILLCYFCIFCQLSVFSGIPFCQGLYDD